MSLSESLATLQNKNKRSDNFHITFYNYPESMGNILGRQAKSITRPNIRFNEMTMRRRGFTYKTKEDVIFDPVTVSFFDDDDSYTSTILYAQVMRQLNRHTDIFGQDDAGTERDYRFDLKIDFYNANQVIVETFILRKCFIQELQHEEHSLDQDDEKGLSITLEYDNIDVESFDKLKEIL